MFEIIDQHGNLYATLYQDQSELTKTQIMEALFAGMGVQFKSAVRTTPKAEIEVRRAPITTLSTRKIGRVASLRDEVLAPTAKTPPKTTTEPPEGSEYKVNDRVYLNWPELAESLKLNFSSKRWSFGVVEQFRSGAGIRSTVGVRFESDEHLTWMQPKHLSTRPQTQG